MGSRGLPLLRLTTLFGLAMLSPRSINSFQFSPRQVTQNVPPSVNITCDNTPWQKGGLKLTSLLGCSETHYAAGKGNFITKTVIKIRAATGLIKIAGKNGQAFEGVIPPTVAREDGKPAE